MLLSMSVQKFIIFFVNWLLNFDSGFFEPHNIMWTNVHEILKFSRENTKKVFSAVLIVLIF